MGFATIPRRNTPSRNHQPINQSLDPWLEANDGKGKVQFRTSKRGPKTSSFRRGQLTPILWSGWKNHSETTIFFWFFGPFKKGGAGRLCHSHVYNAQRSAKRRSSWHLSPRRHEVGGFGQRFRGNGVFPYLQQFLAWWNMILWAEMMKSVFFPKKPCVRADMYTGT